MIDYEAHQLEYIADRLLMERSALRRALGLKMKDFASALRAINANNEQGTPEEEILHRAIGPSADQDGLRFLIADAHALQDELQIAIDRVGGDHHP